MLWVKLALALAALTAVLAPYRMWHTWKQAAEARAVRVEKLEAEVSTFQGVVKGLNEDKRLAGVEVSACKADLVASQVALQEMAEARKVAEKRRAAAEARFQETNRQRADLAGRLNAVLTATPPATRTKEQTCESAERVLVEYVNARAGGVQ